MNFEEKSFKIFRDLWWNYL